jgi:hypothetical protein
VRATKATAKYKAKVAKADAKILAGRIFPKYANQSIKGFDIE